MQPSFFPPLLVITCYFGTFRSPGEHPPRLSFVEHILRLSLYSPLVPFDCPWFFCFFCLIH